MVSLEGLTDLLQSEGYVLQFQRGTEQKWVLLGDSSCSFLFDTGDLSKSLYDEIRATIAKHKNVVSGRADEKFRAKNATNQRQAERLITQLQDDWGFMARQSQNKWGTQSQLVLESTEFDRTLSLSFPRYSEHNISLLKAMLEEVKVINSNTKSSALELLVQKLNPVERMAFDSLAEAKKKMTRQDIPKAKKLARFEVIIQKLRNNTDLEVGEYQAESGARVVTVFDRLRRQGIPEEFGNDVSQPINFGTNPKGIPSQKNLDRLEKFLEGVENRGKPGFVTRFSQRKSERER